MMNYEQLGLCYVGLIRQFINGEAGVSTEPVRSPGADRELEMVGSEEGDTVVIADAPAGLHNVGETVGASSDLLEMVAPARVVVNES